MKVYTTITVLVSLMLTGCAAHYVTPGRGADFKQIGLTEEARRNGTDWEVRSSLDKRPLASFPTAIAVARIQDTGYSSRTCSSWGSGKYSIVTTRDVEKDEQLARLSRLPLISGIAQMNRLLLPADLQSDVPLREAAAKLHADMLLIYTFDTTFLEDQKAAPVSVITLGLSPTKTVDVKTTVSAALLDTRNGYIYGLAEASAHREKLTSSWATEDAIDNARQKNEEEAFGKLVTELEKTWTGVVNQYAVRPSTPAGQPYTTR
jgi:hypothetical protein